jgi:hypothetical protein
VSYLPEDTPSASICRMEGHNWGREGGVCLYCGAQLRCGACGRFITIEDLSRHIEKDCPAWWVELEESA